MRSGYPVRAARAKREASSLFALPDSRFENMTASADKFQKGLNSFWFGRAAYANPARDSPNQFRLSGNTGGTPLAKLPYEPFGGAATPIEIMYLSAWSTVMSSAIMRDLGTNNM